MSLTGASKNKKKIRVISPRMYVTNVTTTYITASQQISTTNTMQNWIQFENETITWEGITLIQDEDATPDTYTLKVSKNTVEQTIQSGSVELVIPSITQNVNYRIPFVRTFSSIQDDILGMELKSDDTTGEEVLMCMYGYYFV